MSNIKRPYRSKDDKIQLITQINNDRENGLSIAEAFNNHGELEWNKAQLLALKKKLRIEE